MTDKHHYQRIDVENGYIQIIRDSTEETQELRINAYWKDGSLIKSVRRLYNIKYDYSRCQTWKGAALIQDEIPTSFRYGHLQWENSVGEMGPDWENPYPDNYEPLNPKGTYIFRHHDLWSSFFCVELNTTFDVNICNWAELDEAPELCINLVTAARPTNPRDIDYYQETEQEAMKNFDPKKARQQRIEEVKRNTQYLRCEFEKPGYQKAVKAAHAKEIDIEIPLDPRFID